MLSYNRLLKLVQSGVVKNCPEDNIGGVGIDIRLGNIIYRELSTSYNRVAPLTIDLRKKDRKGKGDFMRIDLNERGGYILAPGELILGASMEVFNIPDDLAAECVLKSSHQRAGLNFLGGFCYPGWTNSTFTFPLQNTNNYHKLLLSPGLRIAQMIFYDIEEVPPHKSYFTVGRYNNSTEPMFSLGASEDTSVVR